MNNNKLVDIQKKNQEGLNELYNVLPADCDAISYLNIDDFNQKDILATDLLLYNSKTYKLVAKITNQGLIEYANMQRGVTINHNLIDIINVYMHYLRNTKAYLAYLLSNGQFVYLNTTTNKYTDDIDKCQPISLVEFDEYMQNNKHTHDKLFLKVE